MQQLVERMLAVGSRLAKDHGAGGVGKGLSVAANALAVGFHVKLLQMGGKAGKRLTVGQHRRVGVAQKVPLPHANKGVKQGGVFKNVALKGELVRFRRARKKFLKHIGAKGKGKNAAPNRR